MTVSVQVPITTTIANGSTAVFPFGFKISKAKHLRVTVNGLARTLGLHYTLKGEGSDKGGSITFLPNYLPPAGAKVVMRRLMPFERTIAYQNLGDLLASTLNEDQDDPVMMIQQLAALSMLLVEDPNNPGLFVWDAQGNRIINVAAGVNAGDAVNLGQLLALADPEGAGVGVAPKLWDFVGDGLTTDFSIDGADVFDPLMFDTALAGEVVEPNNGFTIVPPVGGAGPALRFAVAPADGVAGFTVLRGYAKATAGDPPLTSVASTVTSVAGSSTIDGASHNTLIVSTSAVDITLTIRVNTGAANDWKGGEFFSVLQLGTGKVTIAIEAGGTVTPSPGFVAKTRDQNSIITGTCVYADTSLWAITGDLLAAGSAPEKQCFTLPCSDEATTQIAAATDVYRFRMPYALLLSEVRATLNVAQPSGTVLTVDVKQNGVSIFSTLLTIDNGETTSTTAAIAPVLAADVLGDGDLISVDVTQVGDAGARGLKVQLIGLRA